jgi:hypothetical protein
VIANPSEPTAPREYTNKYKKEVKIVVSDKSIIMLQVAQKCQQGNLDVSIITYIFVYK